MKTPLKSDVTHDKETTVWCHCAYIHICRASLQYTDLQSKEKYILIFSKSIALIFWGGADWRTFHTVPITGNKTAVNSFYLIGFDGFLNPVHKLGDSSVDARSHGVGASQTPWCHTLQDKPVLGITHQRTAAVPLQRQKHLQSERVNNADSVWQSAPRWKLTLQLF